MTDHSEKNRKIAGALEPDWLAASHGPQEYSRAYFWLGPIKGEESKTAWGWQPRDFYRSEEANAMVLEAMLADGYSVHIIPFSGEVVADLFKHHLTHRELIWSSNKTDRKTAICESFLKWIEAR